MKVVVSMQVRWPNGECHKMEVDVPLLMLLDDEEHVMSEEWLRLIDFYSRDAGMIQPNQHLQLITKDPEDDEDQQ